MRVEPPWWISALMRKWRDCSFLLPTCEDTEGGCVWTRKRMFTKTLTMATLTSDLQCLEVWDINVCCLTHLSIVSWYSSLSLQWQPPLNVLCAVDLILHSCIEANGRRFHGALSHPGLREMSPVCHFRQSCNCHLLAYILYIDSFFAGGGC